MLITVLLAVPAVFYSRLYSLNQQIGLGLLLLLATSGFYLLKNLDVFWAGLRNFVSKIFKPVKPAAEEAIEPGAGLDFKILKKSVNIFAIAFVILPALLLSALGIYVGNVWLSCVPLFILALAWFFSSLSSRVILSF